MTMLYVTHDQIEAMTMADRVILMRGGRIEQNGPPEELYERPATIFTARFIGTPAMNVIPAAELGEAGAFALASAPQGHARADLAVGIRPEAMRLGPEGVPAKVAAVEYLGADTLLDTRIGSESAIVRLSGRTATAPATRSTSPGTPKPRTGSPSRPATASSADDGRIPPREGRAETGASAPARVGRSHGASAIGSGLPPHPGRACRRDSPSPLGEGWRSPCRATLSCVFVSKSLASWRSCSCSDGSPVVRLTMRPRFTAGRANTASVQRWTFLYSWTDRNSAAS
jgi:hypothetical protein